MKEISGKLFKMTRTSLSLGLAILLGIMSLLMMPAGGNAADLTGESVSLSDPRTGQTSVSYTLTLDSQSTTAIACVRVEFDTAADGSGGLPTGMSIASIAMASGTDFVNAFADFNPVDSTTAGVAIFTDATPAAPTGGDDRTLVLSGITNGSTAGTSYFVIVNTYSDGGCTTPIDTNGKAAFIFTDGVTITATVDPTLDFDITDSTCDLGTLPTSGTHKGCDIDFDIDTNAGNGWTISAKGDSAGADETLRNTALGVDITANTSVDTLGTIGAQEAFGFNLVAGNTTTPDTGTALGGDTSGVSISGDYGNADDFKWPGATFETILTDTGTSSGTTATALVAANRSATTEAGAYSTTLVLRATANY